MTQEDKIQDGGYYAIKGFMYQFDKQMIEALKNPEKDVLVETEQDIEVDNYVIQVKHKEAKDYFPSLIREPIEKIIGDFKSSPSKKYCLYCYFKNKNPSSQPLSIDELDQILGKNKTKYDNELKNNFIRIFTLQFAENYSQQFEELLALIVDSFSLLGQENLAIIYHSIFISKIQVISIQKKDARVINKTSLSCFMKSTEKTIFYSGYKNYLDRETYEKLIKKQYFTFKTVNVDDLERLFVIECLNTSRTDLLKIVKKISSRYFTKKTKKAPYIYFKELENSKLIELKQRLIDDGDINFTDGTTFDGDKFRINLLTKFSSQERPIMLKFIKEENINEIIENVKFDEVYQFIFQNPIKLDKLQASHNFLKIELYETIQILNFL